MHFHVNFFSSSSGAHCWAEIAIFLCNTLFSNKLPELCFSFLLWHRAVGKMQKNSIKMGKSVNFTIERAALRVERVISGGKNYAQTVVKKVRKGKKTELKINAIQKFMFFEIHSIFTSCSTLRWLECSGGGWVDGARCWLCLNLMFSVPPPQQEHSDVNRAHVAQPS